MVGVGGWGRIMELVFYLLGRGSFLFGDLRFSLSGFEGYFVSWVWMFDLWFLGVVIIELVVRFGGLF